MHKYKSMNNDSNAPLIDLIIVLQLIILQIQAIIIKLKKNWLYNNSPVIASPFIT